MKKSWTHVCTLSVTRATTSCSDSSVETIFCRSTTFCTACTWSLRRAAFSKLSASAASSICARSCFRTPSLLPSRNWVTSSTLEIGADAVLEVHRLADVEDLPGLVTVQIDAGPIRQAGQLLLNKGCD